MGFMRKNIGSTAIASVFTLQGPADVKGGSWGLAFTSLCVSKSDVSPQKKESRDSMHGVVDSVSVQADKPVCISKKKCRSTVPKKRNTQVLHTLYTLHTIHIIFPLDLLQNKV